MDEDLDIVSHYLKVTNDFEVRLALMNLQKILRAWNRRDKAKSRYETQKYRG